MDGGPMVYGGYSASELCGNRIGLTPCAALGILKYVQTHSGHIAQQIMQ